MNVAIIEMSKSHAECIYSQVLFLEKQTEKIHLVIHPKLRDQTNYSIPKVQRYFLSEMNTFFQRIKCYRQIKAYIKKNGIDTVIFNTTTGRIVQELLFFLPRNLRYIGSIHDGRKLVHSRTQKLISGKVKKYFTLNDYVSDYLDKNCTLDIKIKSYYPIYYPEFSAENIKKKADDFWIIIPGTVEQKRRNYFSLIEKLSYKKPSGNVKFILLGPSKHFNGDGEIVEQKIIEAGLKDNFLLFDDFLTDETFHSYTKQADLIMPLIEPGNEFYETYKYSQITGAYNLSFGYAIPLLYHEDLNIIEDLRKFGFDYNANTLAEKITELSQDHSVLATITKKIRSEKKFDFNYQSKKYLDFILS